MDLFGRMRSDGLEMAGVPFLSANSGKISYRYPVPIHIELMGAVGGTCRYTVPAITSRLLQPSARSGGFFIKGVEAQWLEKVYTR